MATTAARTSGERDGPTRSTGRHGILQAVEKPKGGNPWLFIWNGFAQPSCSSLAGPAAAIDAFNDRTLRGTWALSVDGRTGDANLFNLAAGTTLFAVATVTFDGEGGCSSRDRIVAAHLDIPDADPNSSEGFRQ